MALKYSIIIDTLATFSLSIWDNPGEVFERVAHAGYDAVDITAEPDRIDLERYREVTDIARAAGLEVAALLGAWATWHAGEARDLGSPDREGHHAHTTTASPF